MTQDFFLAQLRVLMIATLAYCAGAGILTTSANSFLGAISVPLIILFGPWLWSIYSNVNSKLVPKNSVAIQHIDGTKPELRVGDLIDGDSVNSNTKVVG